MPCPDCPLTGELKMKFDNALNIKVDDAMFLELGHAANKLDCSQSEIIQRCIQLAVPTLLANPHVSPFLPYQPGNTSKS